MVGANLYAAFKSFVVFFSEALAQEVAGTGVRDGMARAGGDGILRRHEA